MSSAKSQSIKKKLKNCWNFCFSNLNCHRKITLTQKPLTFTTIQTIIYPFKKTLRDRSILFGSYVMTQNVETSKLKISQWKSIIILSSNKVLVLSAISSLWFDSGSDGDTTLRENWEKLCSKSHILHLRINLCCIHYQSPVQCLLLLLSCIPFHSSPSSIHDLKKMMCVACRDLCVHRKAVNMVIWTYTILFITFYHIKIP